MTEADLQRVKNLPQCVCCGKKSDAAKPITDSAWFCGTDFDAWLQSPERRRVVEQGALSRNFMDFVSRRKAEALHACGTPIPAADVKDWP